MQRSPRGDILKTRTTTATCVPLQPSRADLTAYPSPSRGTLRRPVWPSSSTTLSPLGTAWERSTSPRFHCRSSSLSARLRRSAPTPAQQPPIPPSPLPSRFAVHHLVLKRPLIIHLATPRRSQMASSPLCSSTRLRPADSRSSTTSQPARPSPRAT